MYGLIVLPLKINYFNISCDSRLVERHVLLLDFLSNAVRFHQRYPTNQTLQIDTLRTNFDVFDDLMKSILISGSRIKVNYFAMWL